LPQRPLPLILFRLVAELFRRERWLSSKSRYPIPAGALEHLHTEFVEGLVEANSDAAVRKLA
jgi:hypothetical protein